MRRTTRIPLVLTSSDAAGVATEPVHVGGNSMEFHVLIAPNNVDLEGSLDGTNWVDLNYDNAAGAYTITALAAVGAGYYKVHEKPKYVRMVTGVDQAAPQDHYATLLIKKDSG